MPAKGLFVSLFFAVILLLATSYGATGQVNVGTLHQEIEGFGASGAWFENYVTNFGGNQTALYNLLFDDLGLDIYRIRNTHEYDSGYMSNTDTIVGEALSRNPNLKIMISSWSPPIRLKSTGKLNEGTLIGGLGNYNYTGFADWWYESLTNTSSGWPHYGVYADYISIQNEPDWDGNDRCLFDPTENSSHAGYNKAFNAVWVKLDDEMGSSMPKMVASEITGFYGASGYTPSQYLSAISDHSRIYGYAHHLYNIDAGDDPDDYNSAMSSFNSAWGSKPLFQTEYEKATDSWPDALNLAHLLHNSLTVEEVSVYLYWELFWDEGGLVTIPSWGASSYTINSDFYGMKHFSAFIFPGWHRIDSTEDSSSLLMSAYISPSNQDVTVVIINTGGSSVSLNLSFTGFSITTGSVYRSTSSQNCQNIGSYTGGSLSLPAQSVTTLSLTGTGDVTPPSNPTGLSATGGNYQVSLDWYDNGESDLNGYNVYRSTYSGGGYSQINGSIISNSDYVDDTVTPDITYYYVVTAVDMSTNESGYSNEDWAIPYDGTPPAVPTALLASGGDETVSLDWLDNSEEDLDGYNVYRSTTSGSGYSKINGSLVINSFYTDDSVTNEITYYYVVTAVDESTNESGYSTEAPATPTSNPPTVYNFVGITQSNTEYNAFACDVDAFPFEGSSDNVNLKTEANDLEYVNISANNTAEWATADAGFLDEIFLWVEMKINELPGNINRIDLTFNGNTSNTSESGASTHKIYVMKAGTDWTQNSSWVQVGSDMIIEPDVDTTMSRIISSDFSTYIDDADGKIIWAVYETTSSEFMNINYLEMTVIAAGDTEPPAAPTGLDATAGDGTVSLDWDDNGESDLEGYNVYRSTTSGSGYSQLNGPLLSTSDYTDNSVTNGTTYYYVVTAEDTSSNESGYSNEDSATPIDPTPPSAPTGLDATAGDGTVSLDWDDNSEDDLEGYNVYRSTASGSGYSQLNGPLLSTSDYTDNSVTNGTTYYYVVTAVDTSSNESGNSNEDSAEPIDTTPPAAPTALVATAGDSTVSLDWDDNTEIDLDGYNVYRSTSQGGGYGQINGPLLSSSDYTDNSVVNGTTYYYVVTAVDANSNESGYSNEDSAKPKIPGTDVEIIGDWVEDLTHAEEAGSNRALIFIAHEESGSGLDPSLTSVTYGGRAMTKIIEVSATTTGYGNYVAAFILDEPNIAVASGDTFTPTWSDTTSAVGYASVFLGSVDQTDPIGDSDSAGTTSSTPNPITTGPLSTEEGDMVIDAATCGNVGSYTLTGFTEGYDQTFGDTTGITGAAGYVSATGADVTPSATYSTGPNRQVIIGFVIQAAAGTVDDPPSAPTGLLATPDNGQVSLDWNDNGEGDLAGYNVYRSTTSGSGYSQLNGPIVSNSNYTDNSASNFITYYYVVTAEDANNNESGYSTEVSATPDLYQNCTEVQAGGDGLVSDLTGNCYVNLEDLDIIVEYWLDTNCGTSGNCGGADFTPTDGDVDLEDYSDFAVDWLLCNNPEDSGCIKNWWP